MVTASQHLRAERYADVVHPTPTSALSAHPGIRPSPPLTAKPIHRRNNRMPHYAKPTKAASRRRERPKPKSQPLDQGFFVPSPQIRPQKSEPQANPPEVDSVPETDSREIRILWSDVMANKPRATSATLASRAKDRRILQVHDSGIGSSGLRTPPASKPGSNATTTDCESRSAKPKENDFEKMVLNPRGIYIDDNTKTTLAFSHFCTQEGPLGGLSEYYRSIPGLAETTVWLEGGEKFEGDIVREYDSMREYEVNEAEYAALAIENLLKREVRNPRVPKTRHWMTERMIQLVAKPDKQWKQPPIVDETVPRKAYTFDIRPDCSYWVSLQAFNPQYRKTVQEYVSVRQRRILCPYLTVEFKKDDSTVKQARTQVAAASAISLFNRWRLKQDRLRLTKKSWSPRHVKVLKHYGLTFTGRDYEFWCVEPNLDAEGNWNGCRMFRLVQNSCDDETGVRTFINWINEIHRWGLTMHGPSCERDVKHCIENTPNAERTSLGEGGENALTESDSED